MSQEQQTEGAVEFRIEKPNWVAWAMDSAPGQDVHSRRGRTVLFEMACKATNEIFNKKK